MSLLRFDGESERALFIRNIIFRPPHQYVLIQILLNLAFQMTSAYQTLIYLPYISPIFLN